MQILPRQNEKDPSRVDVEVMVREKPTQTADVEAEWSVAPGAHPLSPVARPAGLNHQHHDLLLGPECQSCECLLQSAFAVHLPVMHVTAPLCSYCAGDSGRPGLVSLVPGGTITYENRNLFGNAASIGASVTTKNFLAPADDLSFRVQFNQVGPPGCPSGPRGRCSTLTYVLLLSRSSSHSPAPTSLYVARCLPPCMQSLFPTLAGLLISLCSSRSSCAALHVRS